MTVGAAGAAGVAFLVALALVPLLVRFAIGRNLLDVPNARSSHEIPTPRLGGLAVIAGVWAAAPLIQLNFPILVGATLAGLVGFFDDLSTLRPSVKAAGQSAVAFGLLFVMPPPIFEAAGALWPLALLFGVLWITAVVNAYNFMDGIDGIVAGTAILNIVFLAALALPGIGAGLVPLGAAVAGFLVWNLSPARIFLGDSGSHFVGFFLGAVALYTEPGGPGGPYLAFVVAAAVFTPFLFDTAFTLVRRARAGKDVFDAHREHIYQRITPDPAKHRQGSIVYLALAAVSGLAALLAAEGTLLRLAAGGAIVAGCCVAMALLPAIFGEGIARRRRIGFRMSPRETLEDIPDGHGGTANKLLAARRRRAAAMVVDALIVFESFLVALLLRFDGSVPDEFWRSFWPFVLLSGVLFVALLFQGGMYRNVLRYTGIYQAVRAAGDTAIATGLLLTADLLAGLVWPVRPVPLSVVLVGAVLAYVQIVAVRLYPRVFYELSLREVGRKDRALIVGAGEAGVALARQLWQTSNAPLDPVGFIDENEALRGNRIERAPVLGRIEDLQTIIKERSIDQVLIALPTGSEDIDRAWYECARLGVQVKVVPEITEFLGRGSVRLRDLQIQDLLGRQPVEVDLDAQAKLINGHRVLVTGAGGSIGSELSRQVSRLGPAQLVLLDRDESALHYLNEDLMREGFTNAELVVGDVTAGGRIRSLFERVKPHLVLHAAAYKHVPLMELQASEAVINNVGGTLVVARAAGESGAEKFINVSTDKAVNPASVMGATKRLAEGISRLAAEEYPGTRYASVRFGNVLGSRGSVVPTFRRQIEVGGPVTITHPEMTRYFMIIPEAVSLILQAGAMADSSYGTYVLEMGQPVKIADLARKMIELMGARDVEVKFIGLRPGERLHEMLFEEGERRVPTDHPAILRLEPGEPSPVNLLDVAEEITYYAHAGDDEKVSKLIRVSVPNYPAVENSTKNV